VNGDPVEWIVKSRRIAYGVQAAATASPFDRACEPAPRGVYRLVGDATYRQLERFVERINHPKSPLRFHGLHPRTDEPRWGCSANNSEEGDPESARPGSRLGEHRRRLTPGPPEHVASRTFAATSPHVLERV
jgi:hypothetical protein